MVSAADGGLSVASEGEAHEAYAAGDDLFVVRDRDEEMPVQFLRDGAGRVHAVFFGFRVVRRVEDTPAAGEVAAGAGAPGPGAAGRGTHAPQAAPRRRQPARQA